MFSTDEFKWTAKTNLNVQTYISNSVYSHNQTDLDELLGMKYEYVEIPGGTHTDIITNNPPNMKKIFDFFDQQKKK